VKAISKTSWHTGPGGNRPQFGGDTTNLQPLTRTEVENWYRNINANKYEWVIEHNCRAVGNTRLTVDEENRRARYSIGIYNIDLLGKGLGTETTELILRFAFKTLNLHRVDLITLEYNKRAIACYEKCGFIREGMEREGALIEGRFETDIHMSISGT
jgi:RimJ/RimL family protein N-acetyltransferase